MAPRTFLLAGRRRSAYQLAKLIIKFIESLADAIGADPAMRGRLKVLFLPEYNVSLAERLIPASDVVNQIRCQKTQGTKGARTWQYRHEPAPIARGSEH